MEQRKLWVNIVIIIIFFIIVKNIKRDEEGFLSYKKEILPVIGPHGSQGQKGPRGYRGPQGDGVSQKNKRA